MRHTFLIARQEFVKYVTRRGFLLSILMFPLWIVIVTLVPKWTGGNDAPRHHVYAVVDRSGAYAQALTCAPLQQKRQQWLDGARHYAATLTDRARLPDIAKMVVPAPTCGPEPDYTAIEAALRHAKKPGAPDFVGLAADTTLYPVKAPDYLAKASPASLDGAVRRALGTDGKTPLDTVIVIPAGYGAAPDVTAEIWTTDRDPAFRQLIYDTLTREQRLEAVRRVAPSFANVEALDVSASVRSRTPFGDGTGGGGTDQIVPIALAIILFVVSVMNSSVLLQGVVEEKSTRMIEVLLSCATPREITSGKLLGVIAVALTTLAIWALALFALMAIADRDTVSLVFASLRATASLETLPLLLVFFLCGLLIYGSLFLAIGSMANSLADAQSLLGPSMLILMLPNLMIAGVMRDPNGTLASTLSWVPVYTPFFMMLRISSHPPVWQLWGTTILAITTTVLMIVWTGRVFAKHVLTTERPPSFGKLIGGLFGKRG